MSYFLFAGSRFYPAGGAHDLVGVYPELTDAIIFAAVIAQIRKNRYDYDDRTWVNSLSMHPETVGAIRNWEVRIEKTPGDPALQFASLTEHIEGLGFCGIVPLGRDTSNAEDSSDPNDVTLYPLLDPQKRTNYTLP